MFNSPSKIYIIYDDENLGEILIPSSSDNPFFKTKAGWFLYDDEWKDILGPFPNKQEAFTAAIECYKTYG